MKRVLKWVGLVVALVVLGVVVLFTYTFMGRRAVTDGQEFGRVRIVADGFSSAAVIRLDDGRVALVDAGQDPAGETILEELRRRNLKPDAVAAILLTHGHPDHTGAVPLFPDADVMALEAEVSLVEGRAGARGPLPRMFPVSPTGIVVSRALEDGQVLTIGNVTVRVYAVPGHTAGSAAYFVDGVLFVGDSADITSGGEMQGSPWMFSDSQPLNRESLARLEQRVVADGLTVDAVVPSHSGAAKGIGALSTFARNAR